MLKVFNACQVCLLRAMENLWIQSAHSAIHASGQNAKQAQWDKQVLLDLGVTEHLNLSNLVFSEHGHLMLTRNLSRKNVLAPKTVEKQKCKFGAFC